MLSCFLCTSSFSTVVLLFRHVKVIYGMYPGKSERLKCGQTGCCLQFPSYSGFRRHLIKIHALTDNMCVPHETLSNYDTDECNNSQSISEQPSTSSQCQNAVTVTPMFTHKKDMCASIVAKLLGSGVPNTVVLSTIENLQEFMEDLQSDIQNQILNSIPENNTCRSAIEEVFKSLENPFGQLNSDTK